MDRSGALADVLRLRRDGHISRRDFLVRTGALGVSLGAAGALLAACGSEATPVPTSPGVATPGPATAPPAGVGTEVDAVTFALTADVQGIDYVVAYDLNTNPVVNQIIEPLMRTDVQGQLQPNLAESFTESADGLTYVYKLRSGVKLHDGSVMTADDVAASMLRHMDPAVGSYLGSFYERVDTVEASGDLEVTVRMKRGDALWKYSAATNATGVTSKAFLEKHGKDVGSPEVGIIGTGPYRYLSWARGQEVVIERFDDYWDAANRAMKVRSCVFKPLIDEATIVQALGTGEIDATFNLSGKAFVQCTRFQDVELVTAPAYNVAYLGFNTQRAPWSDKRVRQALSYALDKTGVLEACYASQGVVWGSPIVESLWTFEKEAFRAAYDALPKYDRTPENLEKAKQLVQEAGAVGAHGTVLVGNDYDVPAGLAIQAAAKELGMTIDVQRMPQQEKFGLEFSGETTREYDMTVTIWGSDWPDPAGHVQTTFYGPNLIQNATLYNNPEVTKLIDLQSEEVDTKKRAEYLTQIEALVVEDQPWIVLYNNLTLLAQNKRIGGYGLRPLYYWGAFLADFYGREA